MNTESFSRGVKNDPFQTNSRDKLVFPLKYIPVSDPTKTVQQKGSVIYNLADDQICYSDGTLWVHLLGQDPSNQFVTSAANIGSGAGPFIGKDGATLNFKGLSAGAGIIIVDGTDQIILSATGVSQDVVLLSAGGSRSLVSDGLGPTMAVKGISAGANVTITDLGTSLEIASSGGGGGTSVTTTLSSTSATHSLVNDGVGPNLVLKNLSAGANINIISNSSMVVIESAGATSVTNLGSTGSGISLVNDPTGPSITVKSLVAGVNVSIVDNGNDITIDSVAASGANVLLTSVGSTVTGAEYLVNDGTGPNLTLKSLTSSQGILLSSDSTSVDIQNNSRVAVIGSLGVNYIKTATGPTYTLKEFVSGTGINLHSTSTSVYVNSTGTIVNSPVSFLLVSTSTVVVPLNAIDIQCVAWAGGGAGGGGVGVAGGGGGGGGGGAVAKVDVFPGDILSIMMTGDNGHESPGAPGGPGGPTIIAVSSSFDYAATYKQIYLAGGGGGGVGPGGGGGAGGANNVAVPGLGTINPTPYQVWTGANGSAGGGQGGSRLTGRNDGGLKATPTGGGSSGAGGAGGGGPGADAVLSLNAGISAPPYSGAGGGGAGQAPAFSVYAGGRGGLGRVWLSYRLL